MNKTIFESDEEFDASGPIRVESIKIVWEDDECGDSSYLGTYSNMEKPGCIYREAFGAIGRNEFRYFHPCNHVPHNPDNWSHVSDVEKVNVIKEYGSLQLADENYAMQDFERMEALNRGDWSYISCQAVAEVSTPSGNGSRRLQTFQSSSLGGIESDSDKGHLKSIESEELADLKNVLEAFGIAWPIPEPQPV